jgi:hypothetical protein
MPPSARRGLPDNLDPLVDTLSNVVGILVIVVILTQIQVGDAIDRLMAVDAAAAPAAEASLSDVEATQSELIRRLDELEKRRAHVLARAGDDLEESAAAAVSALAVLAALPPTQGPEAEPIAPDSGPLHAELEARREALEAAESALAQREDYAAELRQVPRELVARLPDPDILTGQEQWILVRHGRVYLADRATLIDLGEKAIGRILVHNDRRAVRPDEYETLAHYLRKRDVGEGNFLWRFVTKPNPRARLEWRSLDTGIEASRLESSRALRSWLAARDPSRDFISFQVWNDSFETYLEARRIVESAGFRAGWKAYGEDQEIELPVTFGVRPPSERPVEVD